MLLGGVVWCGVGHRACPPRVPIEAPNNERWSCAVSCCLARWHETNKRPNYLSCAYRKKKKNNNSASAWISLSLSNCVSRPRYTTNYCHRRQSTPSINNVFLFFLLFFHEKVSWHETSLCDGIVKNKKFLFISLATKISTHHCI